MRFLLTLAMVLLGGGQLALGDDGAKGSEKSTQPLSSSAAAWPAPSSERAFDLEFVLFAGKTAMGSYGVSVAPRAVDGKVLGWRARHRISLDVGSRKVRGESTTDFSASLLPQAGQATQDLRSPPSSIQLATKGGTATVTTTPKGGDPASKNVKVAEWMLPGQVGLHMAARFLPLESARYKTVWFDFTSQDDVVEQCTLTVDPQARFEGQKVLRLHMTRPSEQVELFVEPEGREVVQVRIRLAESGMVFTLKPKADAPQGDDILARAPRSAVETSAHVLHAMFRKDRARLEGLFDWDAMHAHLTKVLDAEGTPVPSRAELPSQVLDEMLPEKTLTEEELAAAASGLRLFQQKVVVEKHADGVTLVTWPAKYLPFRVLLVKKDDAWKCIGVAQSGG